MLLRSARVHEINESMRAMWVDGETTLSSERTYEVLVRVEHRHGWLAASAEDRHVRCEDNTSGLEYLLGPPSDAYVLFMLGEIGEHRIKDLRLQISQTEMEKIGDSSSAPPDAIDVICRAQRRLSTMRVESKDPSPSSVLSECAAAFLFHLTYNLDVALVETRTWEDLLRSGRIVRGRRARASEIAPPTRIYARDLLYHYQMGVASESPALAFLSYYHIAEHFFESTYNEAMEASVQDYITSPGFSSKRRRDVRGLIKEVRRHLRVRAEDTSFSESEALRLTLAKYVRRSALAEKIRSYDASLLTHYATSRVGFGDAETVEFEAEGEAKFVRDLAQRIYRIRNSVVHAKDGEKAKFVPFEHDAVLAKEVPLMRFAAEEIIFGSSRISS